MIGALISSPARIIGWVVLSTLAQYAFLLLTMFIWFHSGATLLRPVGHVIQIANNYLWLVAVGHESVRFLREKALAAYFVWTVLGALVLVAVSIEKIEWLHGSAVYPLLYLAGIALFRRRHLHRHA
jgi:hypothetical protein